MAKRRNFNYIPQFITENKVKVPKYSQHRVVKMC